MAPEVSEGGPAKRPERSARSRKASARGSKSSEREDRAANDQLISAATAAGSAREEAAAALADAAAARDEAAAAREEAAAALADAAAARDEAAAAREEVAVAREEAEAIGGGQGTGGGGLSMSSEAAAGDGEDSEALRRDVHALIGQIEALMSHLRDQIDLWCAEDLRAGYEATHERLGPAFGRMHALVADGEYDQELRDHGFAGDHLEFKRRGLRGAYDALVQAIYGNRPREVPVRVGVAAQAALTVAGSIADALQLATPIKEAIALVPTAAQLFRRTRPS
jgi:hypothetical protein